MPAWVLWMGENVKTKSKQLLVCTASAPAYFPLSMFTHINYGPNKHTTIRRRKKHPTFVCGNFGGKRNSRSARNTDTTPGHGFLYLIAVESTHFLFVWTKGNSCHLCLVITVATANTDTFEFTVMGTYT